MGPSLPPEPRDTWRPPGSPGFCATDSRSPPPGGNTAFAEIAQDSLARLLAETSTPVAEDATETILGAFKTLDVHPDVVPGIEALAPLAQLITLSNGSAKVTEALLARAGVREHFTKVLSVDDAPAWKPVRAASSCAVGRVRPPSTPDAAGGRAPLGHPRGSCGRDAHGLAQPPQGPVPRLLHHP